MACSHLRQVEPRPGDGDAGPDVDAFGDLGAGRPPPPDVPTGSSETMRAGAGPLLERADGDGGMGVGEVGAPDRVERAGGDRQRAIERVGAAVRADDVAVARPRHRADDGAALARRRRAPGDRESAAWRPAPGARSGEYGRYGLDGSLPVPKKPMARRLRRASSSRACHSIRRAPAAHSASIMPPRTHYSTDLRQETMCCDAFAARNAQPRLRPVASSW